MKKRMLIKGLVIVNIILFVGIIFQPAIAVTPNTYEIEDDCYICPIIDKIKSLVEKNENKKFSNLINEHIEKYSNLKLEKNVGDFRPICGILRSLFRLYIARIFIKARLFALLEHFNIFNIYNYPDLLLLIQNLSLFRFGMYITLYYKFNCQW